jgi:hypothetical protein
MATPSSPLTLTPRNCTALPLASTSLLPATLMENAALPVLASTYAAVTVWAADMVTEHVPVPEQAPLQPLNVLPAAGCAFRETTVPLAKFAEQTLAQLMPAVLLVTVPDPVPALPSVSA